MERYYEVVFMQDKHRRRLCWGDYNANKSLSCADILKINGFIEPAIWSGLDVVMVVGEEDDFKITTKADLERFKQIQMKVKEEEQGY